MTKEKGLHPRNIHNQKYDFNALAVDFPPLKAFLNKNQYGDISIDFSSSKAILVLNQALLIHYYKVRDWTIPKGHLCPPIPGRADYLHYIADLLSEADDNTPPTGNKIKGLDIGTGTSCIYPFIGHSLYGWKFVGTDINSDSINHCKKVLNANPNLKKNIKIRFQNSIDHIFKDMIKPGEFFDFTMCNPPYHSSLKEAQDATQDKVRKLNISKEKKGHQNNKINPEKSSSFGGKNNELWYPGGELVFTKKMIEQSIDFKDQCRWFTTLVSKKELLIELDKKLQSMKCAQVRVIQMQHGQKIIHILAWRYN